MARFHSTNNGLGGLVADALHNVSTHRSTSLHRVSQAVNSVGAWILVNGLYAKAADMGLDLVNANVDDHRGLAMFAATVAAVGGAYALNWSGRTRKRIEGRRDGYLDAMKREYYREKSGIIDRAGSLVQQARYGLAATALTPLAALPAYHRQTWDSWRIAELAGRHHGRAYARGETSNTMIASIGNAAKIGTLIGLYFLGNFGETMANFRSDALRVNSGWNALISSFERGAPQITVTTLEEQFEEARRGEEEQEETLEPTLPEYPTQQDGGPQVTGGLQGRNFGNGLWADLTGIHGIVPATVTVDRNAVLDGLWQKKLGRRNSTSVVRQAYNERVVPYFTSDPTMMTLEHYLGEARTSLEEINQHIDWNEVARLEHLSSEESSLVRRLATSLNEEDLLAYGLTELMPSDDGNLNKAALDFMLRNFGREFVELIPALYDNKTSFGLYQWTEFAVYDNGERRGASVVNRALPEEYRISGSVIKLEGNDHHKAAYMFAINNLADFVKHLSRAERTTLLGIAEQEGLGGKKSDLVELIALYHHSPRHARGTGKRWLSNGARADLRVSCPGSPARIGQYALKTERNLAALRSGGMPAPITTTTTANAPQSYASEFEGRGRNSRGLDVFRTEIQAGEGLWSVTRRFDAWDAERGDRYEDLVGQPDRVVDNRGRSISQLDPGNRVYVAARPKVGRNPAQAYRPQRR